MARNKQQTRGDRADAMEKARKALELRKKGMTLEAIGEELGGLTGQYVHKLIKNALKMIIEEPASELRALEIARLDALQHEAMTILGAKHLMVNSGNVVSAEELDDSGEPLIDPATGRPKVFRLEDSGPRLAAINILLKIAERRAKLLGLDAPTKTAFTDPEGKEAKQPSVVFYIPSNGRDEEKSE